MKRYTIRRKRPSRIWHRWLGFILVLPLLFVSITGVLLNHAGELGWDGRRVGGGWLLARYGMEIKGDPVTFPAGGRLVSEWGGQLFWDGRAIDLGGTLRGAAQVDAGLAVVCEERIYLLDTGGGLIEELAAVSLPEGPLSRAGVSSNGFLAIGGAGGGVWVFSRDLLDHAPSDPGLVRWAEPVDTGEMLREAMKRSYRGEGLSWSRVLLDLHSGRFFGTLGRWAADLMVVLVVFLSLTGLVLGLRAVRGGSRETSGYD